MLNGAPIEGLPLPYRSMKLADGSTSDDGTSLMDILDLIGSVPRCVREIYLSRYVIELYDSFRSAEHPEAAFDPQTDLILCSEEEGVYSMGGLFIGASGDLPLEVLETRMIAGRADARSALWKMSIEEYIDQKGFIPNFFAGQKLTKPQIAQLVEDSPFALDSASLQRFWIASTGAQLVRTQLQRLLDDDLSFQSREMVHRRRVLVVGDNPVYLQAWSETEGVETLLHVEGCVAAEDEPDGEVQAGAENLVFTHHVREPFATYEIAPKLVTHCAEDGDDDPEAERHSDLVRDMLEEALIDLDDESDPETIFEELIGTDEFEQVFGYRDNDVEPEVAFRSAELSVASEVERASLLAEPAHVHFFYGEGSAKLPSEWPAFEPYREALKARLQRLDPMDCQD